MAGSTAQVLINRRPVGVRFVEHTADTAIEVRAPSLQACFARAAAGMFAVFVAPAEANASMETVELEVKAPGERELLVAWLEELLYLSEVKNLAFETFTVTQLSRGRVTGCARGRKFGPAVAVAGPAVKGVSRSGLRLRRIGKSWGASVIFDV